MKVWSGLNWLRIWFSIGLYLMVMLVLLQVPQTQGVI